MSAAFARHPLVISLVLTKISSDFQIFASFFLVLSYILNVLNSKYIKIKQNQKLKAKFFGFFQILHLVEK